MGVAKVAGTVGTASELHDKALSHEVGAVWICALVFSFLEKEAHARKKAGLE